MIPNEPKGGSSMRAPAPDRSRPTLLHVEDDEGMRELVTLALTLQGYEVTEAGDGEEALRLYAGRPGAFSLVILGICMPGRNGPETAAELCRIDPEVRLFVHSGTPVSAQMRAFAGLPVVGFLEKPARLRELQARVAAALAGRPGFGGG